MELNNQDRRQAAQFLVKAALDWGARGKDIAAFLKVSSTTISHWRGVKSGQSRKPAKPTEKHIEELMAILKYRISQNLGFLVTILDMGGLDHSTTVILARTIKEGLAGQMEHFKGIEEAANSIPDSLAEGMELIQSKGGPVALRTFMGSISQWGDIAEETFEKQDMDKPLNIELIREWFSVDESSNERIAQYTKDYESMLINQAREALLLPKLKGRQSEKK